MDSEMLKSKRVSVATHHDSANKQYKVMLGKLGGARITLIALHEDEGNNLYNKGLERNRKKLVDLEEACDHLGTLIGNLMVTGKLTEINYNNVVSAYSFLISKSRTWEEVVQFINQGTDW